jgi:hypothetical protein
VVRLLASRFNVSAEQKEEAPKQRLTKLVSLDIKERVLLFYNRDDISWTNPGKADFIRLDLGEGKAKAEQKKYLHYSLREAYGMFVQENGHLLSFSTFTRLRPPHVILFGKTPHNVCLCKTHDDFLE